MACGTPVLSSLAGSLPEVVGDAGALLRPDRHRGDGPTLITGLLDHPLERNHLAALAIERAARFTWASAARSLLDCFEELDPAHGSNSLGRTA